MIFRNKVLVMLTPRQRLIYNLTCARVAVCLFVTLISALLLTIEVLEIAPLTVPVFTEIPSIPVWVFFTYFGWRSYVVSQSHRQQIARSKFNVK